MKRYAIIPRLFLFFAAWLVPLSIFAQASNQKDVFVVKPYEPVLSDAVKMNFLPRISDTSHIRPSFSYGIQSRKVPTDYQVAPITAAKMVAEPIPRLYKSYIRLGIGNYLTPLAELNINNLRSSSFSGGFSFRHLSSQWNYERTDNRKVSAGYANNDASLYAEKIMKHLVLAGEANFTANTVHYYGYNPNSDTTLSKDAITQDILHGEGILKLSSNPSDSGKMHVDARLAYGYTALKDNHNEGGLDAELNLGKVKDGNYLLGGLSFKYFQPSANIDTAYHALFELKPSFNRKSNDWRFSVGLNLTTDIVGGKSTFTLYPHGLLEFTAVDKILVPYFGVGGHKDINDYYSVLQENPFADPGLSVASTNYKITGFGGLKGNLGTELAYNVNVSYSSVDHMYFFVNEADADSLGNRFGVQYDNVDLLTYKGEVAYTKGNKLYIRFTGVYNQYSMSKLKEPFHKDLIDFTLEGRYNLMDKIIASAAVYYIGERYALPLSGSGVADLKGVADINLGVEYRYTKLLSAFIHINNLGAARYYQWYQYPSQRFSFMIGFTYAL